VDRRQKGQAKQGAGDRGRTSWRVADLVAAAVELYVKEGRRPLLPSADALAFSLHYS
jgi:hypothetical protein